jgi:hypothetical protein
MTVESVRGVLIVDDRRTGRIERSDGTFWAILDEHFLDALLGQVPCYVGGEHAYWDEIELRGELDSTGTRLMRVLWARIMRDGDAFELGPH